ncbi:trypsin-like peptidase domain-containing protein [Niallia sp. XMNu-256]|uniref:S1C family serine protease n=1 Tax=Niallia sp. XMNu-256 TaxID=3082444 RepID=UPI0030D2E80A
MKKSTSKLVVFMLSFIIIIVGAIGIFIASPIMQPKSAKEVEVAAKTEPVEQAKVETEVVPENKSKPQPPVVKEKLIQPPKDVSEIINMSQPKVFTIFTEFGQGSGFLINKHGDVLTNAHVVEGSLNPVIKTIDGNELQGSLIGYSNTTDIALIRVPDLANREPLPLETEPAEIGDEVIALGSPQGFENTATLGNISGVDRTFIIEPFQYEGIYQTSAAIAPGSSGGPLLNKTTGKVLAINSARHTTEVNIGFSIPIYQIIDTVNQWVKTPMMENEIVSLFYYQDGIYYYQDYMDDYGYFEDGTFNDDYLEYYEIPYDDSWLDSWGYWFEEDEEVDVETEEYDSWNYSSDNNYNEYDNGSNDTNYKDNDYGSNNDTNNDESVYDETLDNEIGELEESGDYGNEENSGMEESTDLETNNGMEMEETPETGESPVVQ